MLVLELYDLIGKLRADAELAASLDNPSSAIHGVQFGFLGAVSVLERRLVEIGRPVPAMTPDAQLTHWHQS